MNIFIKLRWYFQQQWRRYLLAVLILCAISVIAMVPPWLTGGIVDAASEGSLTGDQLFMQVSIMIAIGFAAYGLRYLWRMLLYHASFQLAAVLRQKIYQHLMLMAPDFFQQYRTGDMMARATNDINAVEMTAGDGVLAMVDGVLTAVVVLSILLFLLNWQLTFMALLPWPFLSYYMWRIGKQLHQAFGEAQACFSQLNDVVQENMGAIRVVKGFGQEAHQQAHFAAIAAQATAANLRVAHIDAKYDPAISLTIGLSFFITVAGGAWYIHQGVMSVGELTSFTIYLGYMIWPMFAVGWLLNIVERGSAAYARIEQLLATPPSIEDKGELTTIKNAQVIWQVKQFNYPGNEQQVLQDINVTVGHGGTLGIVGPVGAGKTSLVQLLLRCYQHSGVNIILGGHALEDYRLAGLRQHIAVVPQDPFLFSTTIAENITFAQPHASLQAIRQAARVADIDQDIMAFSDQYQTLVGERGITLSGGQKQRLAIARAILCDAPILVMDDALSAVDVETEKHILHALRQYRRDRTLIVVCHRLSAVRDADHIIVLQAGRMTESGNHVSLLQQQGWYAQMFNYQQIEQHITEDYP